MQQNLQHRIISAIIAVLILGGTVYLFNKPGLIFLSLIISVRGIFEMSRLLFLHKYPKLTKTLFTFTASIALMGFQDTDFRRYSYEILIAVFILAIIYGILIHKKFDSIEQLFSFFAKFILGVIYSATLPALIISILKATDGYIWFFCLLAVVFSGDIGAYIFGTLFGKTKIAPLLSPKKSLQGSFGGILFSALAMIVFKSYLPNISIYWLISLGVFGSVLGQIGDFFESLLKRIAGVKDSGSIMPGHGGVLDRLDGVYFASPLFYIFINYIL